tara:strand:- start:176 stop:445 length:270 start_codon:yes stop_codon:yes gene_type:complete
VVVGAITVHHDAAPPHLGELQFVPHNSHGLPSIGTGGDVRQVAVRNHAVAMIVLMVALIPSPEILLTVTVASPVDAGPAKGTTQTVAII